MPPTLYLQLRLQLDPAPCTVVFLAVFAAPHGLARPQVAVPDPAPAVDRVIEPTTANTGAATSPTVRPKAL